jgi:hypothetical protein
VRVPIDSISPHPRNYRGHPAEQIEQIRASVLQFGQYREVVTSADSVILCGHGVWEALKAEGHETVETHPMDFTHDDPRAEKLLIADNELSRLAVDDEKALASLLASVQQADAEGLAGTGWDDGALDELIGNLNDHVFDREAENTATTKDLVEHKWFIGFVLEQEDKDALGVLIDGEQLPGEKPHHALTRIIRRSVLNRQ